VQSLKLCFTDQGMEISTSVNYLIQIVSFHLNVLLLIFITGFFLSNFLVVRKVVLKLDLNIRPAEKCGLNQTVIVGICFVKRD
jgi:hypothetical protein